MACHGVGALKTAVRAEVLLKEAAIPFITPTIVWPQAKLQGGNTALPINRKNWIKDLLSMAPPIRARPSFLHSQSLPSGSFHQSLILIHHRADRMKTKITEHYSNRSHGSQTCQIQLNYEPCHEGPPKTDGSWWRVLTKRGPLEKGMPKHFSILALRIP